MSVRVALLGNSFASMVQLPALRWAHRHGAPHQVVGIAGADAEKAATTAEGWSIPFSTDDWTELVTDALPGGAPDLVIVSTPVHLHAPMVRAALDVGAAVLCEKPFALDGTEARELRDAARGRLALIDHQTRWSPWRREFKRRVAEGDVGEPWHARVLMSLGSAKRIEHPYSWWYDAARGGGTLGALGSHMLDGVLDQFGSRVSTVTAELETFVKRRPSRESSSKSVEVTADEGAWLACRLENGLPLHLETNILSFGAPRDAGDGVLMEITGSEATLRLEGETTLVRIPHGGEAEAISVDELPTHDELGMPHFGFFPRVLPSYLRDVIAAVAGGGDTLVGAATFDDAVHVMDVLDAARRSASEGRRVHVRQDD